MDERAPRTRILMIADPGLPARRLLAVKDEFRDRAAALLGRPVDLELRSHPVQTRPDGTLRLSATRQLEQSLGAPDATLVLTEMPRHRAGRLLVAEAHPREGVAVVFWPTLGPWARRSRVLEVLLDGLRHLAPAQRREELPETSPSDGWEPVEDDDCFALRARPVVGQARTVLGMVATNAPWRTAPKLSSALAAAAATGAFGVFYDSIWQMAEALSTGRLLLIGLFAMCAMVAWLILGSRLWERALHTEAQGSVTLYNLSTVLTLFLCVLALYVALVAVILLAAVVIITPEYMSDVLGQPAEFSHYTGIAWLSAALGVVAGGLGASFDSEADLRRLTHGRRERGRETSEQDLEQEDGEGRGARQGGEDDREREQGE